ncbi:hypothetical protein EDD18DRAFT_1111540 [Armillaria luteobubalina]|uniref:Uncharacterized protein n=1 Tax=Armillaria luteobubalina TaxID=153913 RepID=A0AA39PJV4_9AGAR|nr:hypothetical protein EDD18DRAFT_1111540 [Armillaria luteobubalina]
MDPKLVHQLWRSHMALCIWTAIWQVKSASSKHEQKACIISEVPYGKQYLRFKILQCQPEREGQSDPTKSVKIKAESLKVGTVWRVHTWVESALLIESGETTGTQIWHLQQDFSQNKQDLKAKSISSRKIRDKETGM